MEAAYAGVTDDVAHLRIAGSQSRSENDVPGMNPEIQTVTTPPATEEPRKLLIATTTTTTLPPTPPFSPLPDKITSSTGDNATSPEPLRNSPLGNVSEPLTSFTLFPFLPPELRLLIWHHHFLLTPRTIELHTRRTHYADLADPLNSRVPRWLSRSRNPAALSVSTEARAAALEFYTVRLPLAVPYTGPGCVNQFGEHTTGIGFATAAGVRLLSDHGGGNRKKNSLAGIDWEGNARPGEVVVGSGGRCLYINPERDMVVVLGELHFPRLQALMEWFRTEDASPGSGGGHQRKRKGIRRLAMSVSAWSSDAGAAQLRMFSKTLFKDLDEFVLFMYSEMMPVADWPGGTCELVDDFSDNPKDVDHYRYFCMGRGRQFRQGEDGWMVVGKKPTRVVGIRFRDGW